MNIQDKIKAMPYWYHKIDLGNGIVTPGCLPHSVETYQVPDDLSGKRILDVGAWDGFWTFEALKRGADEVVAIENWSDWPLVADQSNIARQRTEWDTFDLCKEALGFSDSQCKRITMSLYDVKTLGQFDVVFFFGALYHQRHPLLALDTLSEVCTDSMYIETAICDDYSPYRGIGEGYGRVRDYVMEFYPNDELGGIASNWWSPTLGCLHQMVKSTGFTGVSSWKFTEPKEAYLCRGFAKGTK